MFLDMSRTWEPHRGLGRLFVRKEQGGHTFFTRTAWSGDGMVPQSCDPMRPTLRQPPPTCCRRQKTRLPMPCRPGRCGKARAWSPRSWQQLPKVVARHGQRGVRRSGAPPLISPHAPSRDSYAQLRRTSDLRTLDRRDMLPSLNAHETERRRRADLSYITYRSSDHK